jgi:cobyrinic acid a,c-diamide synthase
MHLPRLVIAGSASGVGKTTVMAALGAALRRRGLRVAAFKCGPDYLDPTYHARAVGKTCHNLDGWMMGRDAVLSTVAGTAAGADLALIEGVMGLYDGVSPRSNEGSAAEIAHWLAAPVMAVVDASGVARTLAATSMGLRAFDPGLAFAGVFANRVGSQGHLDLLRSAALQSGAPAVLGGLPDQAKLAFPERHLGLRSASEDPALDERLAAWVELLETWCDVDALVRVAGQAPPLEVVAPTAAAPSISNGRRCRIAIARDAAFSFYYEDNLRRLESLGAELVPFSPLADPTLPACDGIYLGGGYPELHAAALSANRSLREALRRCERPIYAECGGLMYLADAIRTLDGVTHDMVGLVGGTAVMHEKLQALGYVEVETQRRTLLGGAGLRWRGHQFRYSTLEGAASDDPAYTVRRRRDGAAQPEGWGRGNVLASYVHAHWASNPMVAAGFVDSCSR